MIKFDDGKYYYISPHNRDFELETFLTIRYDKNGHVIGQHHRNKKRADIWPGRKVGWTTWFVRIKLGV